MLALGVLALTACGSSAPHQRSDPAAGTPAGIHKIKHIIVVMQENRAFDEYFGTFPGADGIPRRNGKFTVCVPDPARNRCARPFHDPTNRNIGGPHEHSDALMNSRSNSENSCRLATGTGSYPG